MPLKKITSLQNQGVKKVLELRKREEREKTGLTIIEGMKEIRQAREAGVDFKDVYFCPGFFTERGEQEFVEVMHELDMPLWETNKRIFSKISYGEREEGLLVVGLPRVLSLADVVVGQKPLVVVVEGLEKPGNLGAIFRTCDAAGVDGVMVCDGATDIFNPNVIRASLGLVFSLQVVQASNEEALQFLQKKGMSVCATLPHAKTPHTQADFNIPLAIVVGSEQKGLSEFWQEHADIQVKVPMFGVGDSLNVSVTTAIVVYEAVRQRNV